MNESYFKKILVYGIIILFIGAAVVPSISGYTEKMSIPSIREAPIGIPLNDDDYVNAYWKFNECSGNTLGDSSSPHYDGIINGATWTTGGYSGCGLIFDGVNDYVDLEKYSGALGINKTDDLIISFYFKSSSEGIIYSSTGITNIPELRIELNSNGSISFRMWTAMCGLLLYSDDGYNNNAWHQGKIIFNGITLDPTVSLYIDNDLQASLTEWLCPIQASDFKNTRIGSRASDGSEGFDGVLDELKFVKYEEGNKQAPPIIDGPSVGKPNIEYDYTFITDDPEGDDILIDIDWGDGTVEEGIACESGEEVIRSHKWDEDGRYFIKAKSEDIWHYSQWSAGYEVKIGEQPPDAPTITGPKYGDPQQQLTYTFVADDFEGDDVKYFIDWDDGTTTETGYYASGTPITETHSWETKNDYYITARATDINNKEGDWSEYYIRIGDRPPNKPNIYGSTQGIPKIKYDYAFTSIDPENDDISFDIDWGDNNLETNIGPFPSGKTLSRSHWWDQPDTYKVKARTKDIFNYYSDWSELEVIIPRNKAYNLNILVLLFERFPRAFFTFRYLLGL